MRHWKGFFRYFVVKLKTSSIPILHPLFSNCQLLTINQFYLITTLTFRGNSRFYYIDMIILPKNGQLVFSIRNYIRVTSEIFSISSLVKISLTSFFCFFFVFCFFFSKHSYLCNKKITCWLEHMKFIFLWKKHVMSEHSFFHLKTNFICLHHSVISSMYIVMLLKKG